MAVDRDCVAFTAACPPDAGGGGTYFEPPTRLPEEQDVYEIAEPMGKVLQSFDLPAGENILFHVWGYITAATAGPLVRAFFFIGKIARRDDGSLALNDMVVAGSVGNASLLTNLAITLPGGDEVNIISNNGAAADVEYCLQTTHARCVLETVTLPPL